MLMLGRALRRINFPVRTTGSDGQSLYFRHLNGLVFD